MNLETFLQLAQVSDLAVHPGGEHVVATVARLDQSGAKRISELWQVPVGNAPRDAHLVLGGDEGCHSPQYDDAGTLFFLSKRTTPQDDAGELNQVWCQRDGEPPSPITNEALGVSEFRVAGTRLVVLAPVRHDVPLADQRAAHREQEEHGPSGRLYDDMNVRSWDRWTGGPAPHLIAYDLESGGAGQRRDLTPDFDRELAADFGLAWDLSADGACVATACVRPGPDRLNDSSVLLIDVQTGQHRHLGATERMTHEGVLFSPSGAHVATVRHVRKPGTHGPLHIALYERHSGDSRLLAKGWECSPSLQAWHGEGALLVTTPMDGHAPLYEIYLDSDNVTRITNTSAGGTHSHVRCVGDTAVGLRHTFAQAPDVFRISLGQEATPERRTALPGTQEAPPILVESLQCEGARGTPIQYFVLTDASATAQPGPRPTLLWIHGGPVASWTDGWHWRWNPLPFVAAGYNVVLPNPRGSTGFGQAFIEDIVNNQWGDACFRDLMAVTDAVCARPDVDESKVIAMGGSFGGYMSNWIGTQTERFAAIVTHASLYRLSAFHGTTDWPAYWAHDMGLYPSDDPESFDRYSPHRFVDQWKTPVLITHGEKDYRVPISEALMLFEDLRRRDVAAQLLIFPDENHWILKPRNAAQWYRACFTFLARHAAV